MLISGKLRSLPGFEHLLNQGGKQAETLHCGKYVQNQNGDFQVICDENGYVFKIAYLSITFEQSSRFRPAF